MMHDDDRVTVCYTVLPKNWYERHEERRMSWAELDDFLYTRARTPLGADSKALRSAGQAYLRREGMDPGRYSWQMEAAMTLLAASGADYPELRGISGKIRLRADSDADVWYLDAVRDDHRRYLYSNGDLTRGAEILSPAMMGLFRRVAECIVSPERLYGAQTERAKEPEDHLTWAREHRAEVLEALHATPDEYVALALGPDDARRWAMTTDSVLSPTATEDADTLARKAASMVGSRLRLSEDVAQTIDDAMALAADGIQRSGKLDQAGDFSERMADLHETGATHAQAPRRGGRQ